MTQLPSFAPGLRALAAALVLAAAAPAFAAQIVELRPDVAVHDGQVTLADLFDDAGPQGAVVVASGGAPGANLVLDAGRVRMIAQLHGLDWANSRGLQRVIARAGLSPAAAGPMGSRDRVTEVLVYARDFQTGEIVQPEDVMWSKSFAGAPSDAPHDSRAVIGEAAKRALRAGAPVSLKDVSAPQVIKKDDIVAVAYEAGGIKLILQAKAVTAAAAGETFNVVNPGSKKVVQAVAIGPGEAVVGPQADRIRAALQADPRLFASLR